MTVAKVAVVDLTAYDDDSDDVMDCVVLPPPDRRAPKRAHASAGAPAPLGPARGSATSIVIKDSSSPALGTATAGQQQPSTGAATAHKAAPPWQDKVGASRLRAELEAVTAARQAGHLPQLVRSPSTGVNIFRWRIKLHNFDPNCPGGRLLNADLGKLAAQHRQDHLLLEATFPATYPKQPPLLRVLKPRCVQFSGQLTAGGAVCVRELAPPGHPDSWHPGRCFQDMLTSAIRNMLHAKPLLVSCSSRDSLSGGPLRVHLAAPDVMDEYSEDEARSTFRRMITSRGWTATEQGRPPQPAPQRDTTAPRQPAQPQPASQLIRNAANWMEQQPTAAQQQRAHQRAAVSRNPSPKARQQTAPHARTLTAALRPQKGTADSSASDTRELATPAGAEACAGRAPKRIKRGAAATPAGAMQVDLTDDATVAALEQQMEAQMVAAAIAADEATARVVDLTSLSPDANGAAAAVRQAAVGDAQAELEQARAAMAKLQREVEAMQAEKAAAAAVRAPLAPRPDHWSPAEDAAAIVEYVTLDLRAQQGLVGEEVETILKAVERCHQVARGRVLQIDRVQNLRLWTKYVIRRDEVVALAGTHRSQESLLFHGSSPAVLSLITREGFDIRVSNMGGALGAGAYFAQHLSYSLQYINRVPQGVTIPGLPAAPSGVRDRLRQAQAQMTLMMYQRQLQKAQAAETAVTQRAAQAQGAAATAKTPYNTAATQYNDAVDFHNRCGVTPYQALPGWSHALSQQQLAAQHGRLLQQHQALQQAMQEASRMDRAARAATQDVQRLQTLLAQAQQGSGGRHGAHAGAVPLPSPTEVSVLRTRREPAQELAPTGRQSSWLRSPGDGCTMMTVCRVTLGRIVQVYDNAQAYPEYVLWLAPTSPMSPY